MGNKNLKQKLKDKKAPPLDEENDLKNSSYNKHLDDLKEDKGDNNGERHGLAYESTQ